MEKRYLDSPVVSLTSFLDFLLAILVRDLDISFLVIDKFLVNFLMCLLADAANLVSTSFEFGAAGRGRSPLFSCINKQYKTIIKVLTV